MSKLIKFEVNILILKLIFLMRWAKQKVFFFKCWVQFEVSSK